jgi:outer membrane protein OmpU
MKKIIAAAVTTAFVAPAFAADVTLSGASEWSQVNNKTSTATTNNAQMDTSFTIGFSTETAAGVGVSGSINMDAAGANDGGNTIALSGAFGKVSFGDNAGAMDSIDGATDGYKVIDHDASTSSMNFNDAAVTWSLPSLAEGVSVMVAYSPKDAETGANAAGTAADQSGVMVAYSAGDFSVKAAQQEEGTDKDQGITLTYAIQGVSLAYESHQNNASGTKTNYNGVGASYTMGDISARWSNVTEKTSGGSNVSDRNSFGAYYSLGGGVTLFAEKSSEDIESGNEDETAIGIEVKF